MRISIGKSRKDTRWVVEDWSWPDIAQRLSEAHTTSETMREYNSMTKDEKAVRKDVGGFVGGVIKGGRRSKGNVECRTLITLDADYASFDAWDKFSCLYDYACVCYSTHSHTPKSPRLRYVLPLDREVTPDEYEPIARQVAKEIGIEQFDITTYETNRLMFWPSHAKDGAFFFDQMQGSPVCADELLARYKDWRDVNEWPISSQELNIRATAAKRQGDPESKPGLIGLFNRAYDIPSAIEKFLPDVYLPCDMPDRYTFAGGSTSAGVVLYQNGQFAYSHHATDPAGGLLCNAFDLVRIHKFGELDRDSDIGTPITKLPSYAAMCRLVQNDDDIKKYSVEERMAEAQTVFTAENAESDWMAKLEINKQGQVVPSAENILLILDNDENLKGSVAFNEFTRRLCVVKDTPWKKCDDPINGTPWDDFDDSALRVYLETTYGISNKAKVTDTLNVTMVGNQFHPVRNYLKGLKWDGIKRGEHLFVHYMGAEDSEYVRVVTRKWLTAAVARIMRPGIKFDNMIVLVGAQGIGKSYLAKTLSKGWGSDTFTTLSGKEAFEQLSGAWIIEMGELSVMKKAEVESVKMFISKQEDNFRAAYGRHVQSVKRQCVFFGTTNDDAFLRDRTGNRRFWPISVDKDEALYSVFSLTDEDIDQIWAEAMTWYKQGESLFLPDRIARQAAFEQSKFLIDDPRIGVVKDFLDKRLPSNWAEMDMTERRNFIQGYTALPDGDEGIVRDEISVIELAYELYGVSDMTPFQSKEYHELMKSIQGWKKTGIRKRTIYGIQYVYRRIEE